MGRSWNLMKTPFARLCLMPSPSRQSAWIIPANFHFWRQSAAARTLRTELWSNAKITDCQWLEMNSGWKSATSPPFSARVKNSPLARAWQNLLLCASRRGVHVCLCVYMHRGRSKSGKRQSLWQIWRQSQINDAHELVIAREEDGIGHLFRTSLPCALTFELLLFALVCCFLFFNSADTPYTKNIHCCSLAPKSSLSACCCFEILLTTIFCINLHNVWQWISISQNIL